MLSPISTVSDPAVPTPRQLILRLLLAAEEGELEASSAIRACSLFDISANNARVALARLQAAGLIDTVGRGAYRLGPAGRTLGEAVGAWRDAEQRLTEWDGSWVMVLTAALGRSDRKALRARERAFGLIGMHALHDGAYIRPNNLAGGVPFVRERLQSLGLERTTPVFQATELEPELEVRARGLWGVGLLERNYASRQQALEESMARFSNLPLAKAALEAYYLGDEAVRQIVFDPLLPEPLVSETARRAFREVVKRYDSAGHQVWREFLASAGAVPE